MEPSTKEKRQVVDKTNKEISINRQLELIGLSKGGLYYQPVPMDLYNLELMRLIDEIYLDHPAYGSRQIRKRLRRKGHKVSRKRVQRLMRLMGLQAIYPGPNLSKRRQEHKVYPYLLRNLEVNRPDQVWATDITFIPIGNKGYAYLVAIMDWYSRKILSWRLSSSFTTSFCVDALNEALTVHGGCEIFNSDQGSQFTADGFTGVLKSREIKISMDGKGRCFDNIFIERFWGTVKREEVYLKDYQSLEEARRSLRKFIRDYNEAREHSALGDKTPDEVYSEKWENCCAG